MGKAHADWKVLEEQFPRYLQGDAQATHLLFTELLRVLQGFLRVRLNSPTDAEDLVQATLLKIHFARDRFDPKQSLKTWVFTIASRSLIDHWRGSSSEPELSHSLYDEDTSDCILDSIPSELLDPETKTELHQDINRALMKLKPMERSIVYLYGVEGLSMSEIGEALLITEGAAKLRAHRAYKELRQELGGVVSLALLIILRKWMSKWM